MPDKNNSNKQHWDLIIKPTTSIRDFSFGEIWQYRDLLVMFIKRDIVTVYKQTILGPIWFVVQPTLTSLVYLVIFGNIARISTDGSPKFLFYMAGVVIWNFFSESFNQTATTFVSNSQIFSKVYFPRLIVPLSKVASGFIKFGIQFTLFLTLYTYSVWSGNQVLVLNVTVLLLPIYLVLMAGIGLGFGLLFTSLTTKYRDLKFLLAFGVQLLMYATPVIYPMSSVPSKYQIYLMANPITPIIEGFRYAFLGTGSFNWLAIGYTLVFTLLLLSLGLIVFHKTEKTFVDTV